jgi:cellulose synthase/poly-beta-1,6-N-acetylglucosamine synthase-like glycosyltransferase
LTIEGQAAEIVARAQRPLPPEIAFLAAHGVPHATLREAWLLAARANVTADAALLRHGLMGEERFYRCLADTLGAPLLENLVLDPRVSFPQSILAGIVPLGQGTGPRFALAPAGESLRRLLAQGPLRGIAITTPTALRRAVFETRGPSIAAQAAHALPYDRPEHSHRDGISSGQIVALVTSIGILSAAATHAPEAALALVALLSTPLFLAMVVLRLAAARDRIGTAPTQPPRRAPDRLLPVYTVLVPLYRERRVLGQIVAAIEALDYPPAKLDVKLILEEDDRETREALGRMTLPGFIEVVVAPTGQPRTKPRALNVALPLARGEFTVIYDAEDIPDPGQLRLAVATFARHRPEVVCLQARLVIDNTRDNWLTRLFTIEYAALFDVINPALAALHCPVPLGGTSNHLRTAVLKSVGGWDAWNVTEDADLGIRLALLGYRVADLPSSTFEEAPATLHAWVKQRSRWMKGFLQVCVTHSRHPLRGLRALGPAKFLGAATMTLGTVLAALGFPLFTIVSVIGLATGRLLNADTPIEAAGTAVSLTLFSAGLAAMILPAIAALRRRGWWELSPFVAALPAYYVLISFAAWRGAYEFLRAPSHWNKTDHGLARTSRLGELRRRAIAPWRLRRPQPR